MATKLDKPLSRELSLQYKGRPVIVTLEPRSVVTVNPDDALVFRAKGLRGNIARITLAECFARASKGLARATTKGNPGSPGAHSALKVDPADHLPDDTLRALEAQFKGTKA